MPFLDRLDRKGRIPGLYSTTAVVVTATARFTYGGFMNFTVQPTGTSGVLSTTGSVSVNGDRVNLSNKFVIDRGKFAVQIIAPPSRYEAVSGTVDYTSRRIQAKATSSLDPAWVCTFMAHLQKTKKRATLTTVYSVSNNDDIVYTITSRGTRLLHRGR